MPWILDQLIVRSRDIDKTFDVKREDLAQVKLTSVPKCAVHEVVVSRPAGQDDAELEFSM